MRLALTILHARACIPLSNGRPAQRAWNTMATGTCTIPQSMRESPRVANETPQRRADHVRVRERALQRAQNEADSSTLPVVASTSTCCVSRKTFGCMFASGVDAATGTQSAWMIQASRWVTWTVVT
ncbi:MAG: hypothetical protein QOJ11_2353 [Frankiales bacterium]|nr:hypothetical protein [Frankiales bacterium]